MNKTENPIEAAMQKAADAIAARKNAQAEYETARERYEQACEKSRAAHDQLYGLVNAEIDRKTPA